jgi:hypothetical protein
MPSDQPAPVDLREFSEAAGASLAGAQGELTGGGTALPSRMAIADAELELKAVIERAPDGKIGIHLIPVADVRSGQVESSALSTIRLRFVAVADERLAGDEPKRSAAEAIEEVRSRRDIAGLAGALGELSFDAVRVPEADRWLVTARDPEGRLVREVVVADEA